MVLVVTDQAKRMGLDTRIIGNGLLVVAIAALIGGRLYHVIDQWTLYQDDPIKIILPPYSGLGAYGGLITGLIALWLFVRYHHQSFWRWADAAVAGVFIMQAIARWGNFFNQELYGPPTNLPWGIAIDCAHRVVEYACPPGSDPAATLGEHFHPLFLYESLSGFLGLVTVLWLTRRYGHRLRPGDLVAVFFIWYGSVRFVLELLRTNNWTFYGVPVAQIVSAGFVVAALVILYLRHRGPRAPDDVIVPPAPAASAAEPAIDGEPALDVPPADDTIPSPAAR